MKKKLDRIHTVLTVYLIYRILNILIVGGMQTAENISVHRLYIKDPDHYYSWEPHMVIPELQTVKEYDDLPFCQRAFMSREVYESNIPYNLKIVLMNTGFVLLPWTSLGEYYEVEEKGWYSSAQHIIIYEVFVYNGINVFTQRPEQYFVYVDLLSLFLIPALIIIYIIYSIIRINRWRKQK